MTPRCLLPLLLATSFVAAQNMPVPDGKGRILQVFDLQTTQAPWLEDDAPEQPAADAAGAAAAGAPSVAGDHQYLAEFLRPFVTPALGPGDDLQVLGGRWLTLLGNPAQVASLERLMANAVARRDLLVTTTVRIVGMQASVFEQRVKPMLSARAGAEGVFDAVIPAARAEGLRHVVAGGETIDAPRLTVAPLQRATMSMQTQTGYVQDYTLTRHGDQLIADPIVGVVWDGIMVEFCAMVLDDGLIGMCCDVQSQQLQRPIQEFQADIGTGTPVTIQLPRTTGVHFRQTTRVAAGDLVVLATQKVDGDYLLAIVEARIDRR
ncbi:MAG: hypothetical protein JNM25_10055 [Planctomycetes bacterium]|nr:hypothetical protein [Planctomycetota bacterium]